MDHQAQLAAHAKVNLALLVGPVRPDGYHEVFSLMLPVTLADAVIVEKDPTGDVTVDCDVAPGEENLAARMVRELERRTGLRLGVRVTIHKRIPAAAGLGGGSSDAAAALTAVERLYDLKLPARRRYEVAGSIGADVPFFLWTGAQLAMGRGQILKDVAVPAPLHIVVAVPDLALPTATVYGWHDEGGGRTLSQFAPRTARLTAALSTAKRPRDLASLVENDLEAAVVARHPAIGDLKRRLLDLGAFAAAMSGSGAGVFGLFDDEAGALAAKAALAPAHKTFYVTDLQPQPEKGAGPAGGGSKKAAGPGRSRRERGAGPGASGRSGPRPR